ncbi:MAG: hypothetical protein V2J51_03570 [Erythrobacter sp.]|jgi:hypothetical protein|nr:hypothetical protein [Erythrobacter sp.]
MDAKNPRTGQGARASKSNSADTETLSQFPAISQPCAHHYRVIIARDLWRRCVVSVEPATVTHQPRGFRDHGAAMAYAARLAELEQWPICDRAGGEQ